MMMVRQPFPWPLWVRTNLRLLVGLGLGSLALGPGLMGIIYGAFAVSLNVFVLVRWLQGKDPAGRDLFPGVRSPRVNVLILCVLLIATVLIGAIRSYERGANVGTLLIAGVFALAVGGGTVALAFRRARQPKREIRNKRLWPPDVM